MAQEALAIAWRRLPEFRGESRFSSFVFGIARKLCYRALTRSRARDEVFLEDGLLQLESLELSPVKSLTRQERRAMVTTVSADLDPLEQQVVQLRFYEGLPYDAIERILEIDREQYRSGVRGMLQRCKRHLKPADPAVADRPRPRRLVSRHHSLSGRSHSGPG